MLEPPGPLELQISVRATTLCGSDLHYFHHGKNGDFELREPLTLGHESSGVVSAVGTDAPSSMPSTTFSSRSYTRFLKITDCISSRRFPNRRQSSPRSRPPLLQLRALQRRQIQHLPLSPISQLRQILPTFPRYPARKDQPPSCILPQVSSIAYPNSPQKNSQLRNGRGYQTTYPSNSALSSNP